MLCNTLHPDRLFVKFPDSREDKVVSIDITMKNYSYQTDNIGHNDLIIHLHMHAIYKYLCTILSSYDKQYCFKHT